jgi:hypothetical protein
MLFDLQWDKLIGIDGCLTLYIISLSCGGFKRLNYVLLPP